MTTSVKERIQPELDQAKEESKLRAERISDILKAAASMTFEELKGGSTELNVITRKSLGKLLEELEEIADSEDVAVDAVVSETTLEPEVDEASTTQEAIPTWKELLTDAIKIVRDRRGGLFQRLKDHWSQSAAKVDTDMTDEYGDRYLKAKSVFKQIVAWYQSTKKRANDDSTVQQDAQPVNIEVVDDEVTNSAVLKNVNLLDSELQSESN